MRAFVTGVAGFLGRHVAGELAERGWEVSGCDPLHNIDTRHPVILPDLRVRWDAVQVAEVARPDVDVVVHCGAIARSMWPDDNELWRNNVDATRHVLAWGIPVVHASSSMVAHPDVNLYCKSKEVAEWFVLRARGTALRFGNIWGDGQNEHGPVPNVIAAFRQQIRQHDQITIEGTGRQTRDFVHISDAVSAMVTAVESPRWAVADICTGYQTSILSIAEQFGVPIIHVPSRDRDPQQVVQSPARAVELWGWHAERVGVKVTP